MAPILQRRERYEMLDASGMVRDYTTEPEYDTRSTHDRNTYNTVIGLSHDNIEGDQRAREFKVGRFPLWKRIGNSMWLLEFGNWILGLGSVAAIVGVLVRYNNEKNPDLPLGITLGALVSLLSTVANVFLTVPLAASIGQARWIWFRAQQRLSDFELITDASRSPFSAVELLSRRKGGALTLFGASLTLLILAVNPSVQQVIKYETKHARSVNTTVPIAFQYALNAVDAIDPFVDVDLPMKAAIYRGILQTDASGSTFDVNKKCPYGQCMWQSYRTLQVCSQCNDLTNQLAPVSSNGDWRTTTLPNGFDLTWSDSLATQNLKTMRIDTTGNTSLSSIKFKDVNDYAIADVFVLIGRWGDNGPYASECFLQFCVQHMDANSNHGNFTETVVPKSNVTFLTQNDNSERIIARNATGNWSVEYNTWQGLNHFFGRLFNSSLHQQRHDVTEWPDEVSQATFHYLNTSSDSLGLMFDNLATSMSQRIRNQSPYTKIGSADIPGFVDVRWPWMTVPLFTVVAVLGLLISTTVMTKSAGLEPWKESSTAILFHGLDDDSRATFLATDRKWEMDEMADKLQMRLARSHSGLNLQAISQ